MSERDPNPDPPPPGQSVLETLIHQHKLAPRVQLREETAPHAEPLLKPLTAEQKRAGGQIGKYRVAGELARGGVGAVFKGHDSDLGRDVAMKFLHDRYRDNPALLQRFVEEAQIGGQLQHPGIVPVYDLGLADGRPFFTMKLIKGRTLAALFAERSSPADERRRFLVNFEQVCQTMAYAHARGVVHRDLKPANVMIGAFGEVQVVDWGMGKVLQHGGTADEAHVQRGPLLSVIETVRSGQGSQSIVGSVMGTPAYMPPEQAIGDVEHMDERSDVFALGAILCELLTGKPPYVGEPDELLMMAARAKLDGARERLAACDADKVLVDLALECLSPSPMARPRSASDIARRIGEHLAQAERRVKDAEIRAKTARRTQKLAAAVAVVVAGALVATLVFWKQADSARELAEQAATEARTAERNEKAARKLADEQARAALAARQEADAKATQLRRALDEFDLLANVVQLREAKAAEATLYPAWPEQAPALRRWLEEQGRPLVEALPRLTAALADLRARGAESAGAWIFAQKEEQFLHDTLAPMVGELRAFADPQRGMLRSVEERLAWAESIERESLGKYEREWHAAIADIAGDDVYGGLQLRPQIGLVPLRRDPRSRLWEFCDLRSGTPGKAIPQRDPETGQFEITEDSGLVFVLLPGGKFTMGAQLGNPDGPNYDALADKTEGPTHEVALDAFLLSKYEMTQAQWRRLSDGGTPSRMQPGAKPGGVQTIRWSNPVEQVSWFECQELLARHGMLLPTESQWESACRAGAGKPWSTGHEPASLQGFANLADATAERAGATWQIQSDLDDGHLVHAPVGSFKPNPFGLFDMHGNVWEWCRDQDGNYEGSQPRAGDGLRERDAGQSLRVNRGGSFAFPANRARSAYRFYDSPDTRDVNLGLRPMRPLR
jgi:formylglycine-generating enzyme required for sulfatase activity